MTVIGLVVIGFILFIFFYGKWQDYREERYAEQREDLANSVAEAARKRGLGDLEQLRQEYLALCPVEVMTVLEGDATAICDAMADALLEQSKKRQMTFDDQVEFGFELCALEARQDGGDPDDWCELQDVIDQTVEDALAFGLCEIDSAWIYFPLNEERLSKRGPDVYIHHERRVDCNARLFDEYYYEGFFDGLPDEDEEWPPILDQVYEALESGDGDAVIALLDTHEFGRDEQTDQWLLNQFVYDGYSDLLPEVLARNGGKVNFETAYYDQPLSRAIDERSPKAALILLEAGADAIRPYSWGDTPIVDAAGRGMPDVVKALVAKGADVDGVKGSESLSFAEALHYAARNGHEETALWLLENGAMIAPDDPAQFPLWSPHTLLDSAVVGGSLTVIEILIEMGATSQDPLKLLEGAGQGGNPDVLLLLFDNGYELPEVKYHDRIYDAVVDVIKEEGNGRIENGVRMFEILLDRGLDMSRLDESGWNYGHQAVAHYGPQSIVFEDDKARAEVINAERLRFVKRVIDEVLAAGIDVDQRYESETMLMEAADGGQSGLLRHLLARGADATLVNDEGRTALDIAVREGRRLTAIWDEYESIRNRFGEAIEVLGGTRDMLDQPDEPAPDS